MWWFGAVRESWRPQRSWSGIAGKKAVGDDDDDSVAGKVGRRKGQGKQDHALRSGHVVGYVRRSGK